ncbi:hypothetical protein EYF80_049273 [Liparis tanakae]|uniref:Uncharacterized protein n=1 Tax=Liparis tanakae TaxID=230148 RepID=A0A4Z2FJT2_9TELE|nr:hypothetical protein EYF80_049273 [Liparis tanakae]
MLVVVSPPEAAASPRLKAADETRSFTWLCWLKLRPLQGFPLCRIDNMLRVTAAARQSWRGYVPTHALQTETPARASGTFRRNLRHFVALWSLNNVLAEPYAPRRRGVTAPRGHGAAGSIPRNFGSTHFPRRVGGTSPFTEQITPDTLHTAPRLRMHASASRSPAVRRPHCSLRWRRHGRTSVVSDPVTLPVRPISSENRGTSRARRYDVISKAARTARAARDTPRPPCWEGGETPVDRPEQRRVSQRVERQRVGQQGFGQQTQVDERSEVRGQVVCDDLTRLRPPGQHGLMEKVIN